MKSVPMSSVVVIAISLAVGLVVGRLGRDPLARADQPAKESRIGKYQISSHGWGGAFMVDTETGELWRYDLVHKTDRVRHAWIKTIPPVQPDQRITEGEEISPAPSEAQRKADSPAPGRP
jgi:hypothetical protein